MAVVKLHATTALKYSPKGPHFKPGMLIKTPAPLLHADAPLFLGNMHAPGYITFKFMTQHPNFINGGNYKALVDILKDQIKDHSVQKCICLLFSAQQGR